MNDRITGEIETNQQSTDISLEVLRTGDRVEFGKVVEMYSAKIYPACCGVVH